MIGRQIGNYRITDRLGEGGMGEVFRAEDTRLKRAVAIKALRSDRFTAERDRLRFEQEARAASALSHPNIVQIHGLESDGGDDFIVMEYVAGKTLAKLLQERRPAIADVLNYSRQLAAALAEAHRAGIIHRDIKPANIVVADSGVVKVLDFGLAKIATPRAGTDSTITDRGLTETGVVMGTAAYMSPEQAAAKEVGAASDVFSAGVLMYELLTGLRPFRGETYGETLGKVMLETPQPVRELRPETPAELAGVVERCMEKDPATRYQNGGELAAALAAIGQSAPVSRAMRVAIAAALIAAIGAGAWLYQKNRWARWAREEAVPRIRELIETADYVGAFDLTREALAVSPNDPQLKQHWSETAIALVGFQTEPPGARLLYRRYGTHEPPRLAGVTPMPEVSIPLAYLEIRVEKDGFEPVEFANWTEALRRRTIRLTPAGKLPPGMVAVEKSAALPAYYLDRFEVTNRQYEEFVKDGGYRHAKRWGGAETFVDKTGQPGPSTWELGTYPAGAADLPVTGVSWYEAGTYCQSVGKALPTIAHWRIAAGFGIYSNILWVSNSGHAEKGVTKGGKYRGMTPSGVFDMAGNAKEWCFNEVGDGRRAILGGAWNEPRYMFRQNDGQDPLSRGDAYGVRCASYPEEPPPAVFEPEPPRERTYDEPAPASEEKFSLIRQIYAYDKGELDAKVESVDDSTSYWRLEKVSFTAGYGGERIVAYLYLPKNAKPPYQTVLWAPGGYAGRTATAGTGLRTEFFNFLPRTGRAVLYPVYKTSFERSRSGPRGPVSQRENAILAVKDAMRSLDYLESRTDIDGAKFGYVAQSAGSGLGLILMGVDQRIKASVLMGATLPSAQPEEVRDPSHFAPRIRTPLLMLNGRYDFGSSVEAQKGLFQLLGAPAADKRHIIYEAGHTPPLSEVIRETLAWMDKYLGPVVR